MFYLEILFTSELREGDLEILQQASREQPGLVQLGQVTVGQAENSQPVYSRSGAKLGFITQEALPPYYETYQIAEAGNNGA